jgi:ferredoxin-NADP reductase
MLDTAPSASSVLALVATVHTGFFLLRGYSGRRAAWWLAVPSSMLAVLTWVWSQPLALGVGLCADAAWFAACQVFAPRRADAALQAAEAAHRFVPLRVLDARDESSTIRTFRLARPPGFDFVAGQFLTVQVELGGRRHVRCYSISSAPEVRDHLEISVRRQGLVSGLLHARVGVGSEVLARRPAGRFVYPTGNRPVVLLAGGIGITPLLAMARHAATADPARPVTLIYSVRHAADVAFREELRRIERAHPAVRAVVTVTSGTAPSGGFRHGRIDASLIRDTVSVPAEAVYLVCGPLGMIEASRSMLAALGVPAEQVRYEAFEAAAAVGAKVPGAGGSMPSGIAQAARALRFARSRIETTVLPGESLLEAAERAGIEIRSVCRSGVCGTCRTRLVSGHAGCTSETLAPVEREKGYILPCVSWPDSDCVIEA